MNRDRTFLSVKGFLIIGVLLVTGISFAGCGFESWHHGKHHARTDTGSESMEERRKGHEKRRRRRMRRGSPAGSEVEGNAEAPNNGFRETTDGSDTSSRSESAESESDDRTEAPSATEELVALGEETYDRNCASCHGESREGSYFAYPSLTDLSEHLTRKQTRDIIEKGPGSMPSFAGLSGQKKDALVTFLHEE